MSPPSFLKRILARKRAEVEARKRARPEAWLREQIATAEAPAPRDFHGALWERADTCPPAVIAEIKRASPSAGVIRDACVPEEIAVHYASAGATALSVLTDQEFQGADADLHSAREAVDLPVLRKDFTLDPYQITEARWLGADCVLLIVAALDDATLTACLRHTEALGLATLVEVHDASELRRALRHGAHLIGINNRDLHTFETRLETSLDLAREVPKGKGVTLVAESGIYTGAETKRLSEAGIQAFLIGESLMRAPDPGLALADLLNSPP